MIQATDLDVSYTVLSKLRTVRELRREEINPYDCPECNHYVHALPEITNEVTLCKTDVRIRVCA